MLEVISEPNMDSKLNNNPGDSGIKYVFRALGLVESGDKATREGRK